jgi:hypothetical protein
VTDRNRGKLVWFPIVTFIAVAIPVDWIMGVASALLVAVVLLALGKRHSVRALKDVDAVIKEATEEAASFTEPLARLAKLCPKKSRRIPSSAAAHFDWRT